ncbi:peptide-methionine (S)-S-oxide reductase [Blastopirellula marina]|uniref:Peptide methionine sulfoxide reductase MsrA n=1 Tax=Blastopirellula marina TaxID=124 RepID=A0A2S8FXL3_9BACT|nr:MULTISPECIES: peptide-methionine (S)-S-oxide reductase MsrA [Pirellulaceae]PQO36908.1 peptide-methionine (S)-S-oxide reductase [Blastopirellula marina]RCS53623.1 peptide-methionine (S)-S-oxide reductase [Bremerella cremea]
MADLQTATFGGGCFWCTEAVFLELRGVQHVESGYAGGHVANPTYEQVCTKTTGHAEVIQITYDAEEVSYEDLLEIFFQTHDPTTKDRQGNDVGPQYRSAIFYHSEEQKQLAEAFIARLNESGAFPAPIVTEVTEINNYYPAENYHQDYLANNPSNPYCAMVVRPKVDKFRKQFADKLR